MRWARNRKETHQALMSKLATIVSLQQQRNKERDGGPSQKLTLCQHWSDHQAGPDQELFVNGVRLIVLREFKEQRSCDRSGGGSPCDRSGGGSLCSWCSVCFIEQRVVIGQQTVTHSEDFTTDRCNRVPKVWLLQDKNKWTMNMKIVKLTCHCIYSNTVSKGPKGPFPPQKKKKIKTVPFVYLQQFLQFAHDHQQMSLFLLPNTAM